MVKWCESFCVVLAGAIGTKLNNPVKLIKGIVYVIGGCVLYFAYSYISKKIEKK